MKITIIIIQVLALFSVYCHGKPCPKDCLDVLSGDNEACNGVYTIAPDHLPPFKVYCDITGGGWIVFQRRMDGAVDFYRTWEDYQRGFGDLEGEFWLGLDKLHRLTKANPRLTIDLQDFSDAQRSAVYSTFIVGSPLDHYKVTIDGYSGTAGDSLTIMNGTMFSTKDKDNDNSRGHCAQAYQGGWWYNGRVLDICHRANLNGRYLYGPHLSYGDGVIWNTFRGYQYSLKFAEMKLRKF